MTHRMSTGAKAALIVAAAGAVFTLGLVLAVSDPGGAGASGAIVLVVFWAFAVSPYLALALIARRIAAPAAGWAALVAGLLMTLPAAALYVLGFFVEPDAQSGLLFIFIPFYQFLAGGLAALVSAIVLRLARRPVR